MHLSGLDLWLWLASLVEHVALVIVLWTYGRAPVFPIFTAWISANVARTVTLFFVYRHGNAYAYYYTYLSLGALDIMLQAGVAYEIALHIFRPANRWSPGAQRPFTWAASVALLLSAALTWLALPATNYLSDTLLIRGNFLSAVLLSEVFVGMLVLSARLGLPWRTHVARLAQGLGAYSIVCVVIEALHTYFGLKSGTHVYRVVSRGRITVYLITALYWIVNLTRSAPAEREIPEQMQVQLIALQRRATSLLTLLQNWRGA